ncbi:MAG: hypothetical protein KME30_04785 [Iphinoe sp. HA4291-MV1]|nr:hypothetical protein [Iphinoe sp. HA4291-MV1]
MNNYQTTTKTAYNHDCQANANFDLELDEQLLRAVVGGVAGGVFVEVPFVGPVVVGFEVPPPNLGVELG